MKLITNAITTMVLIQVEITISLIQLKLLLLILSSVLNQLLISMELHVLVAMEALPTLINLKMFVLTAHKEPTITPILNLVKVWLPMQATQLVTILL